MVGDGKGAGMLPEEITHCFAAELMCWEEGLRFSVAFPLLLECLIPAPHPNYN